MNFIFLMFFMESIKKVSLSLSFSRFMKNEDSEVEVTKTFSQQFFYRPFTAQQHPLSLFVGAGPPSTAVLPIFCFCIQLHNTQRIKLTNKYIISYSHD